MKYIIKNVDYRENVFKVEMDGRKTAFYLTNRLAKIFMPYLDKGVLVDFEIFDHTKKIGNYVAHQVSHFNLIEILSSGKIIYDHSKLKNDMAEFLEEKPYYLFIDLEMTMPQYRQKKFVPEIIQYGFVLKEHRGKTIAEDSSYIFPIKQIPLSKRTIKFLKLDEEAFNQTAQPYTYFYEALADIIKKYNPKLVVWGKNDIVAMDLSYGLHNKVPLTKADDFVDLLKLHKDYFNLRNDLGLFKAYQTYYKEKPKQLHCAKDDAIVTKDVFEAFITYMSEELDK